MDQRMLGLVIAGVGVVVVLVGLLVASGGLSWLGRLPGDLRFEGQRTRVYVPITSMIVISLVLTALLWLIGRR